MSCDKVLTLLEFYYVARNCLNVSDSKRKPGFSEPVKFWGTLGISSNILHIPSNENAYGRIFRSIKLF